jgi:hypothetical protein
MYTFNQQRGILKSLCKLCVILIGSMSTVRGCHMCFRLLETLVTFPSLYSLIDSEEEIQYGTVGGVWVWGAEKADRLYSARLPSTALMNPIGKGRGLPRLRSIYVLYL